MSDNKTKRIKKIIAVILIIIGLPASLSYAGQGGNFLAIPFGIMLAIGIDMLVDIAKVSKKEV